MQYLICQRNIKSGNENSKIWCDIIVTIILQYCSLTPTICGEIKMTNYERVGFNPDKSWLCLDPIPDVGFICSTLHPCSPFSESLCVHYWQEALTGNATQPAQKRRLNMVWWGMWENSRVHLYVHQPAFQPTILTSESLDKGRLCPPHLLATPCPAPAPILPSTPSCCTSSPSLFSLAGPCPRIAQQVPSENRAGDVGRVMLSLSLFSTVYLSLSSLLQIQSFVSESN